MPWPRIVGTQRAITLTASPPAAATRNSQGPGWSSLMGGGIVDTCWNRAMLVSRPISLTSTQAERAPSTPIGAAIRLNAATRPVDVRGNEIDGMSLGYIVIRYVVMPTGAADMNKFESEV